MNKIKLFTLLFLIAVSSLLFVSINSVSASEIYYGGLLGELTSSDNFNLDDYPAVDNDYSLDVITIAESEDSSVYLYVYQPAALSYEIVATSINMTTNKDLRTGYRVYTLTLIERVDVFAKYVIDDFKVLEDEDRYYTISTIYRDPDENIDENIDEVEDGYITNEIKNAVAKSWYIHHDLSGNVICEMVNIDYVDVRIDHIGSIKYNGGYIFSQDREDCLGYYVAFSALNWKITRIIDADIYYKLEYVFEKDYINDLMYKDSITTTELEEPVYDTLKEKSTVTFKGTGLFAQEYTWNRIETAKDTLKNYEGKLSDEAASKLNESQWVFHFYESDYITNHVYDGGADWYEYTYYNPLSVTLLRLHFTSNGKTYNLGVVSNRVSPDHIIDGNVGPSISGILGLDLSELFKILKEAFKYIIIAVIIIGLIALCAYFPGVFKVLINILIFPFNLIASLFKKKDEKTDKKKE